MKKTFFTLLFIAGLLFPVSVFATKIKYGKWKTTFDLHSGVQLPVNFFFEKGKTPKLVIQNGEEHIVLNQFTQKGDSVFIPFSTFDSELKLKIRNKALITGAWFNRSKSDTYNIPLTSVYEGGGRYPFVSEQINMDGRWEVTFNYEKDPTKAIGLFHYQEHTEIMSNVLYGTFLTETGDYRFLEGATLGDSIFLSCFDGSHAFLFQASLNGDTIWGDFYSGNHYKTNWFAVRNESFELGHPDSLTYVVSEDPIGFELPNIDGTTYTYPNKLVEDKVVLIQIMGTWCPNCLDESNYLKTLKDKHSSSLEIIAISFETQKTPEAMVEKVQKYKEVLHLDYTFLIGGQACKPCAGELFPQLSNIISFPTLIFIDKQGKIRKIHTGFNGPGTGEYYTDFTKETDAFIEALINE